MNTQEHFRRVPYHITNTYNPVDDITNETHAQNPAVLFVFFLGAWLELN